MPCIINPIPNATRQKRWISAAITKTNHLKRTFCKSEWLDVQPISTVLQYIQVSVSVCLLLGLVSKVHYVYESGPVIQMFVGRYILVLDPVLQSERDLIRQSNKLKLYYLGIIGIRKPSENSENSSWVTWRGSTAINDVTELNVMNSNRRCIIFVL